MVNNECGYATQKLQDINIIWGYWSCIYYCVKKRVNVDDSNCEACTTVFKQTTLI